MNLREGRIGGQESAAIAAIALSVSGLFITDNTALYSQGNGAYLSVALSAVGALLLFLFCAHAMERAGVKNLFAFLRVGLGPVLSRAMGIILYAVLTVHAAAVLSRFVLMLNRFAFAGAAHFKILLYLAPAAGAMAFLGLESLGRTARLFCWVLLASLFAALLMAIPSYEPYRLSPFPGAPLSTVGGLGLRGVFRFLPGLLGLLIVAKGVHGTKTARRAGVVAGLTACTLSVTTELCLGMTYSYEDLRQMHSPVYRLTMGLRTGGYFPRLDQLLLFGWVIASALAAGFYQYTAALLWCEMFGMHDARPAALGTIGLSLGLCLLSHMNIPFIENFGEFFSAWGALFAALPVALAIVGSYIRIKPAKEANV